jgi:hypothetical protein
MKRFPPTRFLFVLLTALTFAACSNDANTGEHNEGINREGQRNNIESADNPTTPGDNPDNHRNATPTNEDTAQMQRKVTGDQVPGDTTNSNR